MFRYRGNSQVRYGLYWNAGEWQMTVIPREGGVLPGERTQRYVRIPTLLFLVLAPVIGGFYVVFLPFIGFAMLLVFASRKLAAALQKGFREALATAGVAWRPGEAYLAPKRRKKEETPGPTRGPAPPAASDEQDRLASLRREIENRRKG